MSGATSLPNAVLPNRKAADPYQESTATSIATTGQPPASREREARSIARCDLARSTGADRMARYKVNPARRAARKVGGASCERHATIDAEDRRRAFMPSTTGRATCVPARSGSPNGHPSEPRVRSLWDRSQSARATTAGQRHRAREDCATERSAAPDACVRVGLQIVSRLDVCTARTPTVCLDSLGLRSPGLAP